MIVPQFDSDLSAPNLINIVKKFFSNIKDPRIRGPRSFELMSFLLGGVAIFFLKCSSLLSFCEDSQRLDENLKKIFGILNVPSDTHFRTIVDQIPTKNLKGIFQEYFTLLKNKVVIEKYRVLKKYILVAIDGTGFFESKKIHCQHCLTRKHKNGSISYSHQALPAVIVHPNIKEVIPIGIEFIENKDGSTKNDCEANASKRLLADLRKNYPKENFIILEDSLSSNVPHVLELKKNNMSFILNAKPGNHKKLFEYIKILEEKNLMMKYSFFEKTKKEEILREFHYINNINLNQGEGDAVNINYFDVKETVTNKKTNVSKTTTFSWITDLNIEQDNILDLMKMGRSRWMIENETFNTLKNQDYNFEHNYGHGKNNLTNNMCVFMFISFLIDQIQKLCCPLFQKVLEKAKRKTKVWEYLRSYFFTHDNISLEEIYIKMIQSFEKKSRKFLNSS